MGFFEDKLAAAGRAFDALLERATGSSSPGALGRRGSEVSAWVRDRCELLDDSLAHRGVHVSTLKLAKVLGIVLLAGVATWSFVHAAHSSFKDPVVPVTSAEQQQSESLSNQIVQQKKAAADGRMRPGARPGPAPRRSSDGGSRNWR
jgi:hypothetical protein